MLREIGGNEEIYHRALLGSIYDLPLTYLASKTDTLIILYLELYSTPMFECLLALTCEGNYGSTGYIYLNINGLNGKMLNGQNSTCNGSTQISNYSDYLDVSILIIDASEPTR